MFSGLCIALESDDDEGVTTPYHCLLQVSSKVPLHASLCSTHLREDAFWYSWSGLLRQGDQVVNVKGQLSAQITEYETLNMQDAAAIQSMEEQQQENAFSLMV